jgi:homoserine dehydrogenase
VAADELRLGLIGLGTVGSGVVRLLEQNAEALARKRNCRLRLVHVASRSIHTKPHPDLAGARLSTDPWAVVHDPEVELLVELIGGTEPARSLLLAAIEAGKAVVTANKALLALHGDEIFSAAEERGVPLGFEASVAGGIPILRTLRESLAADQNHALFGIVNGTCNYILTMMREQDAEFETALRSAQDNGLAEADPSFDIDGRRSCQLLGETQVLQQPEDNQPLPPDGAVSPRDVATGGKRSRGLRPALASQEQGGIRRPRPSATATGTPDNGGVAA